MNKHSFLNVFSLFMIQGSNALFPLVLFPYLFIVFDSHIFSSLVILESIMLYIISFSIYSFDVTGVKDVGLADSHQKKVYVFYDIIIIRLSIFLVVGLLSLIITSLFFNSFLLTVFIWLLFPLGMILQCNYYHQAVERNSTFAIIVFCCRLIALLVTLTTVKSNDNLNLVVLILGLNYLVSGAVSFCYLTANLKFSDYEMSLTRLRNRLDEGFGLYLGGLSVALFRGSNILLLSLVSNPAAVAIYALAEKFIKTVQALVRPLNQFAYPKVVRDIKEDQSFDHIFKVILKRTLPQVLILAVGMIILLLTGLLVKNYGALPDDLAEAFVVFFIMSFATVFGVCNYMFGTVGMSLINFGGYYAKSVFIVGVLSVFTTLYLGFHFNQYGAAIAYTLSEIILLAFFIVRFKGYQSNV